MPAKRKTINWDITDEEIPRPGLPDAELLERRQRWYRRLVWSTVILAPLALLTLVFVAAGGKNTTPTVTKQAVSSVTSPGRTAATQAIDAWLAQTPSPLPGAKVLSWDGAKTIPPAPHPKAKNNFLGGGSGTSTADWNTEIDTFTLVVPPPKSTTSSKTAKSATATVYEASISVAIDPHGSGAIATGGPSLIREPKTPSSTWYNAGTPWPGITSTTSVSGAVQQAINGWLSAYTSGSSSSLSLAVGDTNSSHVYVPLTGIKSATDKVIASAKRVAPNGPLPTGKNAKTTPVSAEIVQVTLNIVWDGETVPTTKNNQTTSTAPKTTMDLLVERSNTAAPVVVAWGPPGTGPELKPYQDALSQTQVTTSTSS